MLDAPGMSSCRHYAGHSVALREQCGTVCSSCLSLKVRRMGHVFLASGQNFLMNANSVQIVFRHGRLQRRSDHILLAAPLPVTPYIFPETQVSNEHLHKWIISSLKISTKTEYIKCHRGSFHLKGFCAQLKFIAQVFMFL